MMATDDDQTTDQSGQQPEPSTPDLTAHHGWDTGKPPTHTGRCQCAPCVKARERSWVKQKSFTGAAIARSGVTKDETIRRFVLRATIEDDPAQGITGGEAFLIRDALGVPQLPDWMLGKQVKALVRGIEKLRDNHNADYVILVRYKTLGETEPEIAAALNITRYRVHDALRFCIGYLHGCLDTDGEHARYRGVTPDMLYENYTVDFIGSLFMPDDD